MALPARPVNVRFTPAANSTIPQQDRTTDPDSPRVAQRCNRLVDELSPVAKTSLTTTSIAATPIAVAASVTLASATAATHGIPIPPEAVTVGAAATTTSLLASIPPVTDASVDIASSIFKQGITASGNCSTSLESKSIQCIIA